MLESSKLQKLHALLADTSREELIWINGYIAGIAHTASGTNTVATTSAGSALPTEAITILYGTETGNSKKIAQELASQAKSKGMKSKIRSLDQYPPDQLQREAYVALIMSTHGDGEPPEAARKFFQFIQHESGSLASLRYSVLALGDRAYPLFCKAGLDADERLRQLGANPILPVHTCDVDYEDTAAQWMTGIWQRLHASDRLDTQHPYTNITSTRKSARRLYTATVQANIVLNDEGSEKETHHIELAAGQPIDFTPGDSIGVIPPNDDRDVSVVLDRLNAQPHTLITRQQESLPAHEWLAARLEINRLSVRVIDAYRQRTQHAIPADTYNLIPLLEAWPPPADFTVDELVNMLEPITPRLYSIASSPQAYPDEVHLTVSRHTFLTPSGVGYGKASDYLSGLKLHSTLPFYIHPNASFRLPAPETDVIMIGPGTGVAPFRAFMQERDQTGASGRNWLFFGEQHVATDFLYQLEWQSWLSSGVLTRISLAFSRDQQQKIYVQHRMQESAADLFHWIDSGASVYVCGAREPMSVEVENTLLAIIQSEGKMNHAEAVTYLHTLSEAGRYRKDVY